MRVSPETLTDEEIVEEFRANVKLSLQDAWFATSDEPDGPRKIAARQRVCDAINNRKLT